MILDELTQVLTEEDLYNGFLELTDEEFKTISVKQFIENIAKQKFNIQ